MNTVIPNIKDEVCSLFVYTKNDACGVKMAHVGASL